MRLLLCIILIFPYLLNAQTSITLYSSNTQPERVAVIRYLLDAFELHNSDIEVELIGYSDDDSIDLLLEGSTPDIILADTRLLNRLDNRGLLDNGHMDRLVDRLGRNDFYRGALHIGIPYSAWLQVLWYREDWFKRVGLEAPSTIEAIEKATEYYRDSGKYGIILGSVNEVYTEQCFLHLALANGLEIRETNGRPIIDGKELINSLHYYTKLLKSSPNIEHSWRSRDFYLQQKSSMLFYSTHLMDDLAIEDIAKDSLTSHNFAELNGAEFDPYLIRNTGMITTIEGEERVSYGSVSGFGLFKTDDSDKIKAKEKLIEFLFRDDVYITWLHMSPGGMLPVKKSILENDNFFRDPGGVFKRFGREKIVELTSGIDHLTIINLEDLSRNSDYTENGLQSLVYNWTKGKPSSREFSYSWIKQ